MIRKSFAEHRDLLIKHERLRAEKSAKTSRTIKKTVEKQMQRGNKNKDIESVNKQLRVDIAISSFLGHVVEETHTTAALLREKNLPDSEFQSKK